MKRIGKKGMSNTYINDICDLIINWEGKLTWALLIGRIEEEIDLKVTRQTLDQYFSIKNEFRRRKNQIRSSKLNDSSLVESIGVSEVALLKKVEAQQRKIQALEVKLAKQLDQMKTFIFNVRNIPGVDISKLLIRKDRL